MLGSETNTAEKGILLSGEEVICPIQKFDFFAKKVKNYGDSVFTSRMAEGRALLVALKCEGYEVTNSMQLYLKPAFSIQPQMIVDEYS